MNLDLNSDLGEGESLGHMRALMRWITSANVACGGHAGDVFSMRASVRAARLLRVRVGAHPGPPVRSNLGRAPLGVSAADLELWLLQQVGALERVAAKENVRLHHIKLHGALYHAVEGSAALARHYVRIVRHWWPRCVIYARAGGRVARAARRGGVEVWEEAFADRAYRDDGTLVPREEPGALLVDPAVVGERVGCLLRQGSVESQSGATIRMQPRTICLHGDTPGAVELARVIARALRQWRSEPGGGANRPR